MTVQKKYRESGDPIIASYNFYDFAEGTGYVVFDGFDNSNNTTHVYNLSSNSPQTEKGFYLASENDFDSTPLNVDLGIFNSPKIVRGDAYVTISWGMYYASGSYGPEGYMTCELFKVDASGNESSISTSQRTRTMSKSINSPNQVYRTSVLKIPLTRTKFRKGEKLRLKISYTLEGDGGAGTAAFVLINPDNGAVLVNASSPEVNIEIGDDGSEITNSSGGGIIRTTRLIVSIPFEIQQ